MTKSENLTEQILHAFAKPPLKIKKLINSIPVENNISLAARTIK